jgi:phage gpG-like protein
MELSLAESILYFAKLGLELEHEVHICLEKAAEIVLQESKDEIGTYQGAAGTTAAWESLAPSTQEERSRLGYTADEPLLREGNLRDSLTSEIEGDTAYIGSNSEVAKYQELGTAKIPPRSFLVGAAYRKEQDVVNEFGGAVSIAIGK